MDRSSTQIETQVLSLLRQFLTESGSERAARAVSLDASLERDLGIGSLEKAEVFHRIEKSFDIRLPDSLMVEAREVKDLIKAVQAAKPKISVLPHEKVTALEAKQTDPSKAKTLVEVLQLYAEEEPKRPHIYLQDENGHEEILRYGQLYEMAKRTAQGFINRGLKPGETVAIMLPTSFDFFYAFYGTLLAGGIPVPIYPPFRADQIEEYAKREALILRNAGVRLLITFRRAETLSKLLQAFIPSLIAVTTIEDIMAEGSKLSDIVVEAEDPALIQYTSGSTGNPKGVLLSHANLIANMKAYGAGVNIQPTDVGVSWLPLYHDMGLIGAWLGSLYHGIPLTLLSPLSFLSRPERWLWAIHYHRATLSAAPNFAYELCIKKIEDADIEGLDLSSWRLALNGAEMIYPKTMEKFAERFARYGFKKTAFCPVYGLAECSLALSFPAMGQLFRVDKIQRGPFEKEGLAVPVVTEEKNHQAFIACGKPLSQHEVRIVDDKDNIVPERKVGSIQFRGPSAMQGYYRNPEATQAIYHEGWWETGDLGYWAEEELFITGRKKDLIIKAGRNYYPAEIEEISSQAEGIRKGCVAAFGVHDEALGTEKLIVVAETIEKDEQAFEKIRAQVVDKIVSQLGIPPDEVVLVPPHTIPKTSSGKLRRSSCKQNYLSNKLSYRQKSSRTQIAKLFFQSRWKKTKNWLPRLYKILFNVYSGIIILPMGLSVWFLVAISSQEKATKIFHVWCRWILRLLFCPLAVKDRQHLTAQKPMIFIANHTSYIDIIALSAILPTNMIFIAKKELLDTPVFKTFVKKSNHLVVDRLDFSKSQSDLDKIKKVLANNQSIVIFPEGTFSYATGVRPFKLGAFKVAAEMNVPICPIAIQGARKILRAGSFLLQPNAIKITVFKPIEPAQNNWDELVRLRELTRAMIAQHSGEQAIDLINAGIPTE